MFKNTSTLTNKFYKKEKGKELITNSLPFLLNDLYPDSVNFVFFHIRGKTKCT